MKPLVRRLALILLCASIILFSYIPRILSKTPPIEFNAPDIESPSFIYSTYMTHGGPRCPSYYTHALIPASRVGLMVTQAPILLFHVDKDERQLATEAIALELVLVPSFGENETQEYSTPLFTSSVTVATEELPAILGFRIPEIVASQLQVNQFYLWVLSISCNPENIDPFELDTIGGYLYRESLDGEKNHEIALATPIERVALYAANGIWHDALNLLAELRHAEPDNQELAAAWASLLESAGFGAQYKLDIEQLQQARLLL